MFKNLFNKIGLLGLRLKYGMESLYAPTFSATLAASTTFVPLSSYFVSFDASGNAALTTATSTFISGFLQGAPGTGAAQGTTNYVSSSTAGAESMSCTSDDSALFRVPISTGTYARSNRGKLCDLVVAANLQGAAVQVSTRGHLRIVDGDETNNKFIIAHLNGSILSGGNAS